MTGYAAASRELGAGSLNLELRSVNHRYLDIQFRLSDEFRPLESPLREAIGKNLSRGKVDCRLNFTPHAGGQTGLQLDDALVAQLAALNASVASQLPEGSHGLSVGEILRWPGVIVQESISPETLQQVALELAQAALADLAASRAREGEKLKEHIFDRAEQIEALLAQIRPLIPQLVAAYREKLATALREAAASLDEDRVRQELALFAQRVDVDEEFSRLQTHLGEVRRVLTHGGAVGKRLDFLMQELNREANTLGSKSVSAETTQAAMEFKILIEQMREQIQNIE